MTTARDVVNSVASAKGVYNVILGTSLGASIWHTMINGPIAYSNLPRQQFGNLQKHLFPPFFSLQSAASLSLLFFWARAQRLAVKSQATTVNFYLLVSMASTAVINLLAVGPWTTSIMMQRHRLERLEGRSYNAEEKSTKMVMLNQKFNIAHSVSSLLNLGFLFAAVVHTGWFGKHGLPGQ